MDKKKFKNIYNVKIKRLVWVFSDKRRYKTITMKQVSRRGGSNKNVIIRIMALPIPYISDDLNKDFNEIILI